MPRYERVSFEKPLVAPVGQPQAAFLCPGHPLIDETIDLTVERHRDLLRRGTVLVDGANSLGGYSLLKANNLDAVVQIARGCPILRDGGTIDVCETFKAM